MVRGTKSDQFTRGSYRNGSEIALSYNLNNNQLWLQIMVPNNFNEFIDALTNHVKNGVIPMSRIDDAVKRILRVKFVMGLFENPLSDLSLSNQLGSQVNIGQ